MFTWAVQSNLLCDKDVDDIVKSLEGNSIPYELVKIIPFSDEVDLKTKGRCIIPYGSTSMIKNALNLRWEGSFFNFDTFCYRECIVNRDDMLNGDATIKSIHRVQYAANAHLKAGGDPGQLFFMRPIKDLKEFCGKVTTLKEIARWARSVDKGSFEVSPDCEVLLANPKKLFMEWRHFVVGGKIISSASYKANGQLVTNRELDQNVIDEAQKLADKWLPSPCCAMDTAWTEDGLKVIEFNCINSSGFYDHDIQKIVVALTEYCETKHKED